MTLEIFLGLFDISFLFLDIYYAYFPVKRFRFLEDSM